MKKPLKIEIKEVKNERKWWKTRNKMKVFGQKKSEKWKNLGIKRVKNERIWAKVLKTPKVDVGVSTVFRE